MLSACGCCRSDAAVYDKFTDDIAGAEADPAPHPPADTLGDATIATIALVPEGLQTAAAARHPAHGCC